MGLALKPPTFAKRLRSSKQNFGACVGAKRSIDSFVFVAAVAPVLGVTMATHMSEPAWLLLCFALTLFL
jgi:hypothetical protein